MVQIPFHVFIRYVDYFWISRHPGRILAGESFSRAVRIRVGCMQEKLVCLSSSDISGQPRFVFLIDESCVSARSIVQRAFKYGPAEAQLIRSDSDTLDVEHVRKLYQSETKQVE